MRDTTHSDRIFMPLGGSYVLEDHGPGPPPEHSKGWGKWPMMLIVLLLGATTAAAAIMATGRTHAPVPELWKQSPPAVFMKAPDGYGLRELLF
jgi:hypothetical protein